MDTVKELTKNKLPVSLQECDWRVFYEKRLQHGKKNDKVWFMNQAISTDKYLWTRHAQGKMKFYRLTESRIKRIIRYPARVEEGILEGAIAAMQPAGGSKYSEIWVMYVIENSKRKPQNSKLLTGNIPEKFRKILKPQQGNIKIITAWRYPGKSPERDPIPEEILSEIRNLL